LPKYIAFLRAINVSGRYIKMALLAEHFKMLGYADVQTVINTGNVLFQSAARSTTDLALALEIKLEPLLGFKSAVFVRSGAEIQAILATAVGLAARVPEGGELNVAFLAVPLTAVQVEALAGLKSPVDDFLVDGCEIYWICAVAQNESKFSNARLEQKLKLRSTLRRVSMLSKLPDALFE
jgi:uncharacterized protein (DUF1697 family)